MIAPQRERSTIMAGKETPNLGEENPFNTLNHTSNRHRLLVDSICSFCIDVSMSP